jgi:hypothetical protein
MAIQTTQGSRHRGFAITCVDRKTGEPVDLTGATITGRLFHLATRTPRAIDGTLTGSDLENGEIQWNPGTADVGTAGEHELQLIASIAGLDFKTFRTSFFVEAAIPAPS